MAHEPPSETDWPKIFVSELRTDELPAASAAIVYSHIDGHYGEAQAGGALRAALASSDGAALASLLDEPPWKPSAAEVAAVREAEGNRAANECARAPARLRTHLIYSRASRRALIYSRVRVAPCSRRSLSPPPE